ncbi:hypothetical protein HK102_003162 [Quaeritorhiza haematococci]|nr:hypothetical protein HK102_003162 [Quaeritorhiza haematococci]
MQPKIPLSIPHFLLPALLLIGGTAAEGPPGRVLRDDAQEFHIVFGAPRGPITDLNCPAGTYVTEICGNRGTVVTGNFARADGLGDILVRCSDGTDVNPLNMGNPEFCLVQEGGFYRIGVGHGSFIDRIRDINIPDESTPRNFIGRLGGDINDVVLTDGLRRLTGISVDPGFIRHEVTFRFVAPPTLPEEQTCPATDLVPRSLMRRRDRRAFSSETTSLDVYSPPNSSTSLSLFKRAFTVNTILQVARFVCDSIVSLSLALTNARLCNGKNFLGGVEGKDNVASIRNMLARFGCDTLGNLVEIAVTDRVRVIVAELGEGVRQLCGAIFHIGKNKGFRACEF